VVAAGLVLMLPPVAFLRMRTLIVVRAGLAASPALSQMQLQKSLEQYRKSLKLPKSVVVQHKIGVPMMNVFSRTKYDLQNKLK